MAWWMYWLLVNVALVLIVCLKSYGIEEET